MSGQIKSVVVYHNVYPLSHPSVHLPTSHSRRWFTEVLWRQVFQSGLLLALLVGQVTWNPVYGDELCF